MYIRSCCNEQPLSHRRVRYPAYHEKTDDNSDSSCDDPSRDGGDDEIKLGRKANQIARWLAYDGNIDGTMRLGIQAHAHARVWSRF